MYRCGNCGLIFEKPKRTREYMGEHWGAPAYEEFDVCPDCLEKEINEVSQCDICGKLFEPYQLTDGICEECNAAEAVWQMTQSDTQSKILKYARVKWNEKIQNT